MSTHLYDEALLDKIKGWTSSIELEVFGVDETSRLYEVIADNNEDKPIKLPLITISRSLGFNIRESGTTRNPRSYDGVTIEANDETSTVINEIPISLSYQLDVYTRYAKEADILIRNLIFNIINYPSLSVTIPKTDIEHTAVLTLNDTVTDNSSVPERFVSGNFTRLSLLVDIRDAHLFDTRELHNVEIDFRIDDSYNDN